MRELIDAGKDYITIKLASKQIANKQKKKHNQNFNYYYDCPTVTLFKNEIDVIKRRGTGSYLSAGVLDASLLSALIVAPLASIDKSQPNNFNSKRYISIVKPSLIGIGIGIALYIPLYQKKV